jgi:hypothetical protein
LDFERKTFVVFVGELDGDFVSVGHGESIKNFEILSKENFVRAGSPPLAPASFGSRTLTSKRIAE